MNKIKKECTIPFILITIGLVLIIYSSLNIINYYSSTRENNKINKQLKTSIVIKKTDNNENKYQIDFNILKKLNSDVVGYLKVNNINIDYIVVKHSDNNYYLNHNYEKKENKAGWIFVDYRNKIDETDKNIIIYGHNTRNNSMFGSLKNTLNKSWYKNNKNHVILFVTENNTYYYKVFSTYKVKPENYYIKTDFKSDLEFDEFIKTIKSRSVYNYKDDVTSKDKILTLSSCIGDGTNRVVLHAKLIKKI